MYVNGARVATYFPPLFLAFVTICVMLDTPFTADQNVGALILLASPVAVVTSVGFTMLSDDKTDRSDYTPPVASSIFYLLASIVLLLLPVDGICAFIDPATPSSSNYMLLTLAFVLSAASLAKFGSLFFNMLTNITRQN